MLLEELIAKTEQELILRRPCAQVTRSYTFAWKIIKRFFDKRKESSFNKEVLEDFIRETRNQHENGFIEKHAYNYRVLAARSLEVVFEKGSLNERSRYNSRHLKYDISYECDELVERFSKYLKLREYAPRYIDALIDLARQFIFFVQKDNNVNPTEMTYEQVQPTLKILTQNLGIRSRKGIFSRVRCFLRYMFETGVAEKDLSLAVPSYSPQVISIIPTLNEDEEKHLLSSVNRDTDLGKRDYAILLLGIRTGLRGVDVANLKRCDIDWRKNEIAIVQSKTNHPLKLKLFGDVGNAIADYILNARPDSDFPNIFLGVKSPYAPIRSCANISYRYFKKANLRQGEGEARGFHVFRHSLAANMLSAGVDTNDIANALGQKSIESSKAYLSTDSANLKDCSLGFEELDYETVVLR